MSTRQDVPRIRALKAASQVAAGAVIATACLVVAGQVSGLFGAVSGSAVPVVFMVAVLGGLIAWNALALRRVDAGRRVAEEELLQSKERLDMALTAARIGTWDWDMETDESTSDTHLPRLFGLTAETYAGGLKNSAGDCWGLLRPW